MHYDAPYTSSTQELSKEQLDKITSDSSPVCEDEKAMPMPVSDDTVCQKPDVESLIAKAQLNGTYKDPYAGINFVERHVVIKDKAGVDIFNEKVVFPDFFTESSVKIVASKYLCNTAKYKETDLRMMIDRVSNTITDWGREDGYFKSDEEAIDFLYKLKYYQIHQHIAFNSPVYFNIGISEHPQLSACFILDVEDNMESISEWGATEATIFKFGSGSGVNLSKIRSSYERVRGGGLASGPVSFLKPNDCQAGVIKSGGTFRRSAKMAVMNIKHPDTPEKFMLCKDKEEKKLRLLKEGGIVSEHGYELSDEVYFQNTNFSIRMPDEFMFFVQNGDTWSTRTVITNEVVKTYDAKQLLMDIAEHAWTTGDPGVMFHDNTNIWNTTISDGEYEATNPCGEFCGHSYESCNLAASNLIKYFPNGVFDYQLLKDVVSTLTVAQDILIDRASYPIEKITANTKRYRSLGQGFTNLGGLCMFLGFPYDSDEGRAIASTMSALITGIAYKTSMDIAERIGPGLWWYSNDGCNQTSFKSVLLKHRAALDNITLKDETISQLVARCYNIWDELVNNIRPCRNCQTTLSAPNGTTSFLVGADTSGPEPAFSIISYKTLSGNGGAQIKLVNGVAKTALERLGYDKTTVDAIIHELVDEDIAIENSKYVKPEHLAIFDTSLAPANGTRAIDYMGHLKMMCAIQPFISGAISKCVIGDTLICSEDGMKFISDYHQNELPDSFRPEVVKLASIGGARETSQFYYGGFRETIRIRLKDGHILGGTSVHRIKAARGDYFDWMYMSDLCEGDQVAVSIGANYWSKADVDITYVQPKIYGCQKSINVPSKMNGDIGWLLGAITADGNLIRSTWGVTLSNNDIYVLNKFERIVREQFGLDTRVSENNPGGRVSCAIVNSKELFLLLEWLGCGHSSDDKDIPWSVLQSTKDVVLQFITGLWLYGYVVNKGPTSIDQKSQNLIQHLQLVFDNLGIRSVIGTKYNVTYNRDYYSLSINGKYLVEFSKLVTLDNVYKNDALQKRASEINSEKPVWSDVIPCHLDHIRKVATDNNALTMIPALRDSRTQFPSRVSVENLNTAFPSIELNEIFSNHLHFSPIVDIEFGVEEVYDFEVPSNHAFIGNSIINHNTINMANNCTVQDIFDLYFYAWKHGLKSVTVYRDGSKTEQVLTTHDKSKDKNSTALIVNDNRRKMPKERDASIHKFTINGNVEGYLTRGFHKNGELGEIFITLSKDTPTLRGWADALATITSIALQSGSSLETIISKMIRRRFSPDGFTDNAEIRQCNSIIDYIFKFIAFKHLSKEQLDKLNLFKTDEVHTDVVVQKEVVECPTCSTELIKIGTCWMCSGCGYQSGSCG